jgi:hypothetical protein
MEQMSATPASMLQVVASGLQDRERLNTPVGKPSIQFYKSVMRKRTRWASQWRRVEFDNLADFGRTAVCTLPIQGELITRATLVIDLPDILTPQINAINSTYETGLTLAGPFWAWTNGIGHAICSDVQMLIGDTIIDRFDSRSLEVLDEQTRPVEHFDSTNQLIARNPSTYSDTETIQTNQMASYQTNPQTLEVVFPFWWNRGPGPQPLPIQALWKDKVQLKCTFRTAQECVFTSTRVDPRNPPLSANQGVGPLPNIANCDFFVADPSGNQLIYNATSTANLLSSPINGETLLNPFVGGLLSEKKPGYTMPPANYFHFTDAYWIVEYVSLEDREAAAYRMADLEIPIEQHIPMPVVTTGGSENIRIRMDQAGLVRDLTWVAQRVEATDYNAYFLFTKDLGPPASPATLIGPTPLLPVQNPCDIPWWPNAEIPNWDYGDGYLRPAFVDQRSDPISAAKMTIRGLPRFEHEGSTIFRSLIPILNCKRAPLIDRYIYRYDFGFWATGGLAEAYGLPVDEIRGFSNWDKLPKRELSLTMNQDSCDSSQWIIDTTQNPVTTTGDSYINVDTLFAQTTDGFIVNLRGAHPPLPNGIADILGANGQGASVIGIVDFNQLRRQKGYIGLFLRTNDQGSASLVLQTTAGYTWLAVAASGGYGVIENGGGGNAGSAIAIGQQGGGAENSHLSVDASGGLIVYSNVSNTDTYYPLLNTISSDGFSIVFSTNSFVRIQLNFKTDSIIDITKPPITVTLVLNSTEPLPITQKYILELESNSISSDIVTYTFISSSQITAVTTDTISFTVGVTDNSTPVVEITNLSDILLTSAIPTLAYTAFFRNIITIGTISTTTGVLYGGGGGIDAPGQTDGIQLSVDPTVVVSHKKTGGVFPTADGYNGGDGYYGGGSGLLGGGGGGSYVSDFMTQINSFTNPISSDTTTYPVSAILTPLKMIPVPQPNFNIYSWITRYNRLRINSGRGAIMFNETAL